MRKFLIFFIVGQLCLNSCPLPAYAALTSEPADDTMPLSNGYLDVQQAMNLKNEIALLSQEPQSTPIRSYRVPADPWSGSFLNFSVDLEKNKVVYELSPGQFHEGDLNPKTNTAVITFPSTVNASAKATFKFKTTATGDLSPVSVSLATELIGTMSTAVVLSYSDAGQLVGFGGTYSGSGVWQSIRLSRTSETSWSVFGLSSDAASKTISTRFASLDVTDTKGYFKNSVPGMFDLLDQQAEMKSVIDVTGAGSLSQYEKDASGAWIARHKVVFNANQYESYVLDQGSEKRFIQGQTITVGTTSFKANYSQITVDGRAAVGLILKSDNKTFDVHYPSTDVVEIEGKKYQILLDVDGKLTLKEHFFDLNGDTRLDDADLELLGAQIRSGAFDVKYDFNTDQKVDVADLDLITGKYVDELKKIAAVFVVGPGESIAAAQEKARQVIAAGLTKDVHVLIRSGDYYDTHLELDERDSGQNGFKVYYRGIPGHDAPHLMGGVLLPQTLSSSTWTRATSFPGSVYKINVSQYDLDENSIAGLFVNGEPVSNADSGDSEKTHRVSDMPAANLIPQYFPNASTIVIGDGSGRATKVGTYIGDDANPSGLNNSPSWEEVYPIDISYVKINPALSSNVASNWKTVIKLYSNDKSTLVNSAERLGRWDRQGVIEEYKAHQNMKAIAFNSYQAFKFKAGDLPADFDFVNAKVHYWCSGTSVQEIRIKTVVWDSPEKISGTIILEDVFGHPITRTLQADGTYATSKPGREVLAGGRLGDYIIGHEFSVKNSKTSLSEGEFYYDGDGRLYYSVPSGKTMADLKIVLPTKRNIIKVEGSDDGTAVTPVRDVVLDRLDLSMTQTLNQLKDLYNGITSSFGTFTPQDMAAVYFHNTENVVLKNSKIHHTGATGVSVYGHAQNVRIAENEIAFTGADGIVLNGDEVRMMAGPTDLPRHLSFNNQIVSNHIHHVGARYEETMGIYLVQSGSNLIANNVINHISYNGLYIIGLSDAAATNRGLNKNTRDRYSWNYASDNKIIGNDFSHVNMKMDDGGAIYTLESGKNNEIAGNKFHDIYSGVRPEGGNAATFGIYLDCGQASFFNIHDNIFFNFNSSTSMPMNVNGSSNIIKNNTFVQNNVNYAIQFKEATGNEDNVLENNVFINTHPNGRRAFKVRLYNQIRVPTTESAVVPANAFKVKEWNTASPTGYSYYLYYYSKQLRSSDHNVFYNKSGIYNVEVNYFDIYEYVMTPSGPAKVMFQQGIVPFSQWKSQIAKGLTVQHDTHSVIAPTIPVLNTDLTLLADSPYYGKGARFI